MKPFFLCMSVCVLLLGRLPAEACSCSFPFGWDYVNDPIKQGLQGSAFVGIATVVAVERDTTTQNNLSFPVNTGVWVTLRIEKAWKGMTNGTLRVYDYLNNTSCYRYSIAWYDSRNMKCPILK
jgi:hypothetical protein